MFDNPVLMVIVGVLGLVAVSVAAYYIIRFMRGSIKLTMVRTTFNPGEKITGSFEMTVKKPIQGNKLVVSLIGQEVETYRRNGKTHTRTHEIYRDEKIIEEARSYSSGHHSTHEFEIQAPDDGSSGASGVADNAIAQTIVGVAKALGAGRRRLKWRVEARLDAKGVDLATSKKVMVNLASRL